MKKKKGSKTMLFNEQKWSDKIIFFIVTILIGTAIAAIPKINQFIYNNLKETQKLQKTDIDKRITSNFNCIRDNTECINKIKETQIKLQTNQLNTQEDIQEIKKDIKEIKDIRKDIKTIKNILED